MDNNLREVLMPLAIFSGLGGAVYMFVSVMTSYILKKKMIEKGYVNEETQAIFKEHVIENKYSSLKWGLIVFFGGLSLILMEFFNVTPQSPLPYGLFAVSVSLGFLIYYFVVNKSLAPSLSFQNRQDFFREKPLIISFIQIKVSP